MNEMADLICQYRDCLARVREQAKLCDSVLLMEQLTLLLSLACAIYRESVVAWNETSIMLNLGEILSHQQVDLPTAAAGILSALEVVNPVRRYN